MNLLTIVLFFVYTWGLGFSVTFLLKNAGNPFERNLARVGIGLGIMPIFAVILNFFRIVIDWRIFFIASVIMPFYYLFQMIIKDKPPSFKFKLTKSTLAMIVVVGIFAVTFYMYHKGAFAYPYLEDDDPWAHARSIKYIAVEKTLTAKNLFKYLDPYPPGYDAVIAILHQTSPSLSWTMKYFNALIISLGIIFFYLFAKEFIRNRNKALFSVAVLAMVPCYLSHFIWSHALFVTLIFPAFYCIERIRTDKRWMVPSSLVVASLFVVQPTQAIKFSILLGLYIIVKSLCQKRFDIHTATSAVIGLILSMTWWATRWKKMFIGATTTKPVVEVSAHASVFQKIIGAILNAFKPTSGTATRAYTFQDFFVAKSQNMINNPVGVGVVLMCLLIVSLIVVILNYKKFLVSENYWVPTAVLWLVFTFLGINSVTFNLPVGLFAFRFWMLFAIPLSLLSTIGAFWLMELGKNIGLGKAVVLILLLIGIFFTSGIQKFQHNTSPNWPPGVTWTSIEELRAYLYLLNLPTNTRVFTFGSDGHILGLDKYVCTWCPEIRDYEKNHFNDNATELYSFLKKHGFKYYVIGGYEARHFGLNRTNAKLQEIASSGLFVPVHQTPGAVIFAVS